MLFVRLRKYRRHSNLIEMSWSFLQWQEAVDKFWFYISAEENVKKLKGRLMRYSYNGSFVSASIRPSYLHAQTACFTAKTTQREWTIPTHRISRVVKWVEEHLQLHPFQLLTSTYIRVRGWQAWTSLTAHWGQHALSRLKETNNRAYPRQILIISYTCSSSRNFTLRSKFPLLTPSLGWRRCWRVNATQCTHTPGAQP